MPVRVDLSLDAAVAEDAFGDDGDHVDAPYLRGDDEWGGLVVGISRAGSDGGDEIVGAAHDAAVPLPITIEKRNDGIAARHGAVEYDMRIDAHQLSIVIAVAIARTGPARLDVAQDGTGIASDGGVFPHVSLSRGLPGWRRGCGRAWPARGGCE